MVFRKRPGKCASGSPAHRERWEQAHFSPARFEDRNKPDIIDR